jgi:raffinose synthase
VSLFVASANASQRGRRACAQTLEPQIGYDAVTLFGVGLLTSELQLAAFYKQLHAPLHAAGVDGVKVDVQSGVPALGGGVGGGPRLARMYTRAMEASVVEHFTEGGTEEAGSGSSAAAHCINCMCHSTENLYQYSTTAVARASDDFCAHLRRSHTKLCPKGAPLWLH